MRKLSISTGESRARDTYGYTIVRLKDSETGKLYRCSGGGYDMVGTVLAAWLEDVHADKLRELAHAGRAHATYSKSGGYKSGTGELYGMTYHADEDRVSLDGACGVESVRRIAEAAGVTLRSIPTRSGYTRGWYADEA